jgi:tetrahydromethanopterin S-methyltransferase subunit D
MKKNVGRVDAILRITCGLTGLAWSSARMVRHPYRTLPMIGAFLSAMKVAEGITRYCPILDLFGVSTIPADEQRKRVTAAKKENYTASGHDPSI